jgi:hypothetical protein
MAVQAKHGRLDGLREALDAPPRSNGQQAPRKLTYRRLGDLKPNLTGRPLVKGILDRNTFNVFLGKSGAAKSFFAMDLSVCIASGTNWNGYRIKTPSLVVYVALEGVASAENRLLVARDHRGIAADIPLIITPGPVNLREPADAALLCELVSDAKSDFKWQGDALVIMDTLARGMAGGKENTPEDMGAYIAGADKVRIETGSTLISLHHLGKDETKGGRGHSSLQGATDTEIEIVRQADDVRVATITKQRDLATEGERFAYRLKSVVLGEDEDGEPVTTCAIEWTEAAAIETRRPELKGKAQRQLLAALRAQDGLGIWTLADLRDIGRRAGLCKATARSAAEALATSPFMMATVGGWRLADGV